MIAMKQTIIAIAILACVLLAPIGAVHADECQTLFEIYENDQERFSIMQALSTAATPSNPALFSALVGDAVVNGTVFSPTNEAFNKLFDQLGITLDQALLIGAADLGNLLLGHILPLGDARSSDSFTAGEEVQTLLGTTLTVDLPTIKSPSTEGKVIEADLLTCTGFIHVIDGVLVPVPKDDFEAAVEISNSDEFAKLLAENDPGCKTALGVIADNEELSTLELLVQYVFEVDPVFYSGINDPTAVYTLFAPTNDAFDDLFEALGTDLSFIQERDEEGNAPFKATVDEILRYHIIDTAEKAAMLGKKDTVETQSGTLTIDLPKIIGDQSTATVTQADIEACGGIIHVIDTVLLPDSAPAEDN